MQKVGASELIKVRTFLPMSRRGFLTGAAAGGAAFGLGFGSRSAHADANVTFLGWQGYEAYLEGGGFPSKNGLTLQKSFASSADEMVTKLRLGSSAYDLLTPYFINDPFLQNQGLIEALDLTKIPNFAKIMEPVRRMAEPNMAVAGTWYAAPFVWGSAPLMYNSDVVTSAPASWKDMMKPEFKGKCAIPDDISACWSVWGRVANPGIKTALRMTREQLARTVDLLVELKKNHLRTIASSYGDLTDLAARKEIVIFQGFEPVASWVGKAAPIKWTFPVEGTGSFIEGYAIGRGSANIEAAHVLINNALSPEGQKAGADANGLPVVVSEAIPLVSDWNRASYPYDNLEDFLTKKVTFEEMYYLDDDGTHATWDEYQEAWERILKA
ncbi:extracellular solute-binding protein [Mesorhizobium sp. B2-4-2]|nr:extracellular solute-binding protein [Mesorhizobium sp. B2-4-2]